MYFSTFASSACERQVIISIYAHCNKRLCPSCKGWSKEKNEWSFRLTGTKQAVLILHIFFDSFVVWPHYLTRPVPEPEYGWSPWWVWISIYIFIGRPWWVRIMTGPVAPGGSRSQRGNNSVAPGGSGSESDMARLTVNSKHNSATCPKLYQGRSSALDGVTGRPV